MKDYSFGNFICALRVRRGLSQFQLGTLVGVSNKAVSKWENGASKPQISTCRKLAEVLGVTLDELLSCKYLSSASAGKEVFAMSYDLWEQAHKRLLDIYGPNPPVDMIGRFETEKMLMMGSGLIAHFGYLSTLAEYSRKIGSHISLRGEIGNSFVAWLLGITDVNPMQPHYLCDRCKTVEFCSAGQDGWDLPPKRCACGHMMYPDGHRLPCEKTLMNLSEAPNFDINMPPELLGDAERLLREYFAKDAQVARVHLKNDETPPSRCILLNHDEPLPPAELSWEEYAKRYSNKVHYVFCRSNVEQGIQELCRATNRTPENVDFLAADVISAYTHAEIPECLDFAMKPLQPLLRQIKPNCFSGILKTEGLQHSTGAWEDNQELLWKKGMLPIQDVIAFREDVFDTIANAMVGCQYVGSGLALNIMEQTRKGRYYHKGMPDETKSLLIKMGVPDWYIDAMKKVLYLFPRAHSISSLHSEMILMWFYVHERELFLRAFGE